jgi:S-adenosylmethionine-diacylglycerol 3-amino-3-carboxypropyl transferase
MKSFNQTINYASSNEDSHSEIKSLNLKKSDTVLCITGSGSRSLDLLTMEPEKIVSIDINPCQNHLLELKLAAIKNLEYDSFLQFLGFRDSFYRLQIYLDLRHDLTPPAQEFWDKNLKTIAKGVIYQGRWEKYFRLLSLAVRFARPKLLFRLFTGKSLTEQEKIWREEWDNKLWRKFLKTIGGKFIWKYFLRDPGFFQYVPDDFNISDYLINKFNEAVKSIHFRRSAFATLLFWGKFIETNVLPPHLQKENFSILKDNINHINILSAGLGEHLNKCKSKSYDKYSLSDFSSYTNQAEYDNIWSGIVSTARPNACICERQFLVKRDIPSEFKRFIIRNPELEDKLVNEDSSIFYTFLIGQVCENIT